MHSDVLIHYARATAVEAAGRRVGRRGTPGRVARAFARRRAARLAPGSLRLRIP